MVRSAYGIELRECRIIPSLANGTSGRSGVTFISELPAKRSRQDNTMWGRLASTESFRTSPPRRPFYTRQDDVNACPHVSHPAMNRIFEPVLCRPPVAEQNCSPTLSGEVSGRGSRQRGSGVENGVKTKQGLSPGAAANVSTQPNGSIGRTTQREGRSLTGAARSSLVAFCEFAAGHPFRSRGTTSTRHITSPTES